MPDHPKAIKHGQWQGYVLRCDEDVPFDDGFYQFVAKRMIEDREIKFEYEKVM